MRVAYFKRRKCLDCLTDFHIEERGKIKVDEITQALAERSLSYCWNVLHICDPLYENWNLRRKLEKF